MNIVKEIKKLTHPGYRAIQKHIDTWHKPRMQHLWSLGIPKVAWKDGREVDIDWELRKLNDEVEEQRLVQQQREWIDKYTRVIELRATTPEKGNNAN